MTILVRINFNRMECTFPIIKLFSGLEDDSVDRSRPTVQHIASTDHRIKFRVVELKPKRNLSEAQVVMDPHTLQLQQDTNDDDADVPELDSSGEVNTGGSARRDKGKGVDRGVGEEFAEVQGEASARMEVGDD